MKVTIRSCALSKCFRTSHPGCICFWSLHCSGRVHSTFLANFISAKAMGRRWEWQFGLLMHKVQWRNHFRFRLLNRIWGLTGMLKLFDRIWSYEMDKPSKRQRGLGWISWVYQWDERYKLQYGCHSQQILTLTRSTTFCRTLISKHILMQIL